METRLEQQPRQQAAPKLRQGQGQTMQASQAHINQEVAVALERLNGLMMSTLDRVKALEDDRKQEEDRREERQDNRALQRPELNNAVRALWIAAAGVIVMGLCSGTSIFVSLGALVWNLTR